MRRKRNGSAREFQSGRARGRSGPSDMIGETNRDLDQSAKNNERIDKMKHIEMIQVFLSGALAYISARLGILFPVLLLLMGMMAADYITGMMAGKVEAAAHPDDPSYGWNSKKGAVGIIKKVGYLCVIAVALTADYVILNAASSLGFAIQKTAVFGLMVTVWYLLNEMLSVIENAGRMGAPVPAWLADYIAVLKHKVEENKQKGGNTK